MCFTIRYFSNITCRLLPVFTLQFYYIYFSLMVRFVFHFSPLNFLLWIKSDFTYANWVLDVICDLKQFSIHSNVIRDNMRWVSVVWLMNIYYLNLYESYNTSIEKRFIILWLNKIPLNINGMGMFDALKTRVCQTFFSFVLFIKNEMKKWKNRVKK